MTFFDKSVEEALRRRIAGHALERQHGDGAQGAGCRGFGSAWRDGRRGRRCDRHGQDLAVLDRLVKRLGVVVGLDAQFLYQQGET